MLSSKLIFAVLLCASIVLAVFVPKPTHPTKSDAVIITHSFWGNYQEWLMWRDIKTAFEQENPNIWIKQAFIPGQYDDKIRLMLSADSAPDLMQIQDEPFPVYRGYGKFENLDPYIKTPGCSINLSDYFETGIELFTEKGKLYGMPVYGGENVIYYNRDLFDKEGVPYPDPNWTFADFIKVCQRLTRDLDGDGRIDQFGFYLPYWNYWLSWTWGMGADLLNKDRAKWTFNTPEALASLQLFHDMRFKYNVVPRTTEFSDMGDIIMFMTGRVAMVTSGPWLMPALKQSTFNYGVAHIPIGPAGRHTRVTWDGIVMFSLCKHKPEAWRFIQFVASQKGQEIVASYARSVPILKTARDAFLKTARAAGMELFYEAMDYAQIQPISVHWFEMSVSLGEEYQKLGDDKQTSEQTMARLNQAMTKIFGSENEKIASNNNLVAR